MKRNIIIPIILATFLGGCSLPALSGKETPKKNTQEASKKEEVKINKSKDDTNYNTQSATDPIITIDNEKNILHITSEAMKETEETNKPTKITLKIKDSEVVFTSDWNDGIYLSVTDFDKNDKYADIYITETGTDIQCNTYIYRFDGTKIYKYGDFTHLGKDFLYDGNGDIYYWNSGDKMTYDTAYNYITKKSSSISDEKLKKKLNEHISK